MTWFKVDDSFHSHPKVLATPPAALGLWVVAGAWCSSNLTDGFVPDYALPRLLPDAEPLAKQLVASRLWKRAKGGHWFRDWGDYNPTSESVKEDRAAARERMRVIRESRRQNSKPAGQPQKCSPEQEANFGRSSGEVRLPRPDPTRTSSKEEVEVPPDDSLRSSSPPPQGRAKRGTRIPDQFAVTADMIDWARTNAPHVDASETAAFVDYWRAVPGAKGTKLDWAATWRTWMRRTERDQARASPRGLVEHNGRMLKPETVDNLSRRARFAAIDAANQTAIEGPA